MLNCLLCHVTRIDKLYDSQSEDVIKHATKINNGKQIIGFSLNIFLIHIYNTT